MSGTIRYRQDIDGLRALAIIPVVLFHADLSTFSGGFVGVDIFFVISGYLITNILLRDIKNDSFSILKFYERRIRRIIPALFVVLAATQLAGFFLLLPHDNSVLAQSSLSALFFGSNFFFWHSSSGYFAPTSETYPLLHTWSLSIEEQFYLFFPILFFFLLRKSQTIALGVISLLSILSLFACIILTEIHQITAFYQLPTRAWELGTGSILAAINWKHVPRSKWLSELLGILGLVLIILSIFLFDEHTSFPGSAALVPVLGAAFIIASGETYQSKVSLILSSKFVVFFGLISYSLYLWHWPVFVFVKNILDLETFPPFLALSAISACILLATISWAFIEAPFRRQAAIGYSPRAIFVMAMSGGILLSVGATTSWLNDSWPARFSEQIVQATRSLEDTNPDQNRCFEKWPGPETCIFPASHDKKEHVDILIWGDSHADALMPGFVKAARELNLTGLISAKAACPPLLGIERTDKRLGHNCKEFNDAVLRLLKSRPDLDLVILSARWPLAAEGKRAEGEGGNPALLSWSGSISSDPQNNFPIFQKSLQNTVSAILATNRDVLLVGSVPEIGWNVPQQLIKHFHRGTELPKAPNLKTVKKRQMRSDGVLQNLAKSPSVYYMPITSELCQPDCKTHLETGSAFYSDDDHISAMAARSIVPPLFERALEIRSSQKSSNLN